MDKRLRIYIIIGFFFVSILGTLSHFFYTWLGKNPMIALFSPINESTWEHMKLLFFPMLIYTIFLIYKFQNNHCLATSMLTGTIAGTLLIPILFYTYSGVLGFNIAAIDISTFYISVIFAFILTYHLLKKNTICQYKNVLLLFTTVIAISFFVFTFIPPNLGIFISPV